MSKPMLKLSAVTLDCPDQEALADFYANLLGWEKKRFDEEWLAVLSPEGNICLLFQEVSDYVPPVWPNEPGKQQQMTHLDFAASPADKEEVIKHALACGAKLSPVQYSDYYTVFIDPAGHPFCISFFD